jgi:hypothetical protein
LATWDLLLDKHTITMFWHALALKLELDHGNRAASNACSGDNVVLERVCGVIEGENTRYQSVDVV